LEEKVQKKVIITTSLIIVLIIAVSLGSFKIFIAKDKGVNLSEKLNMTNNIHLYNDKENLECLYYNDLDFINIKDFNFDEDYGTIRGIIVPHHLLAKDLINEAFQVAAKNGALEKSERQGSDGNYIKYKTIVVFGPDHESKDRGKVFTSISNWQSPMGILNSDKDLIRNLSKLDFVIENDEKMTVEHSISGLVPFIKHYFSDAKIVPLALTKQLTLENLNSLLYLLVENLDIETTLFISSVDFSHYLSLEEANKMDEVSIEAIINKDIEKIMKFTNDNMDSPNSIVAMLNTMELIEAEKVKIINKTNSQIILNKKIDETTSYVTFLFY